MKKLLKILCLFLYTTNSFALTEGVYIIIVEKQKQKESSRWSLADWFSTKKKIALMDQWLALNSSTTWLEFILEYSTAKLDENIGTKTKVHEEKFNRLGASLYVKFLGFEYNYFNYNQFVSQNDLRLNLLILGSSVQSTHIRGFAGKRDYSYDNYSSYKQSFQGGAITLYLSSFLGTEFIYTRFNSQKSIDGNYEMHGERKEYGVFIELSFLRLYFNKFSESSTYKGNQGTTKKDDGVLFGAKFFL